MSKFIVVKRKATNGSLAEEIGRKVKRLRQAAGMTQEELAEKLDLHVSFVGHLERGGRKPGMQTLERIASVFNIPPHEFFAEQVPLDKDTWLKRCEKLLPKCNQRQLALVYGLIHFLLYED